MLPVYATFRETHTETIKDTFFLPVLLDSMYAKIDQVHVEIGRLTTILDLFYSYAENSNNPAFFRGAVDSIIKRLNDKICGKISYLRKLESTYLRFFPMCIRKPLYRGEEI